MFFSHFQNLLFFADPVAQHKALARLAPNAQSIEEQVTEWARSSHFLQAICIPMLVAVAILIYRTASKSAPFEFDRKTFVLATVLSIPLTEAVYASGLNGYLAITVFPIYPILLIKDSFLNREIVSASFASPEKHPFDSFAGALLIYPITFSSALLVDIFCAFDIGFRINAIGGAGFKDGLFLYPAGALFIVLLPQLWAHFRSRQPQ